MSVRYRETGAVHLDFHRTTNGTIAYLRQRYGVEFLDEILRGPHATSIARSAPT